MPTELGGISQIVALVVSLSAIVFSLINARQRRVEMAQKEKEIDLKADDVAVQHLRSIIEELRRENERLMGRTMNLEETVSAQEKEIARLWRLIATRTMQE